MEYKPKEFRKNFTDFIALQAKDSGDRPFRLKFSLKTNTASSVWN